MSKETDAIAKAVGLTSPQVLGVLTAAKRYRRLQCICCGEQLTRPEKQCRYCGTTR